LCTAGVKLDKDEAHESYKANRNGGGFAFVDGNGEVVADKGYFDFDKFWQSYSDAFAKFGDTSPFLIHFRIATAGKICSANCHPFVMGEGKAALIHNGMLWSGDLADTLSDTAKFAQETEGLLGDVSRMTPAMVKEVGSIVGATNKIVMLYSDKTFKIINENGYSAHWNKDKTIWYSNRGYESWGSYRSRGTQSYGTAPASSGSSSYTATPSGSVYSPSPIVH
jgi:predicted glutamine amidotransferase